MRDALRLANQLHDIIVLTLCSWITGSGRHGLNSWCLQLASCLESGSGILVSLIVLQCTRHLVSLPLQASPAGNSAAAPRSDARPHHLPQSLLGPTCAAVASRPPPPSRTPSKRHSGLVATHINRHVFITGKIVYTHDSYMLLQTLSDPTTRTIFLDGIRIISSNLTHDVLQRSCVPDQSSMQVSTYSLCSEWNGICFSLNDKVNNIPL